MAFAFTYYVETCILVIFYSFNVIGSNKYIFTTFICKRTYSLLRKKASFSAASAQLRSCRKASQKLRKSRRYWHLWKSWLLRRTAEKPAFTKLLRNSAEKLQKSRLFYSFYEAFTQVCIKIVMMSKSCGNAAITQVPIPPAFAKLLHAAFTQTCVKAG